MLHIAGSRLVEEVITIGIPRCPKGIAKYARRWDPVDGSKTFFDPRQNLLQRYPTHHANKAELSLRPHNRFRDQL